jgi:hypothetical protein
MAISDVYTARNAGAALASSSITAILSLYGAATKRIWVVGVRVELGKTAAAAGNSSLFQLARPNATNTPTTGASGSPHDFSAIASLGQVTTLANGWSTTPTLGTVLWEQQLPQTTGSAWEEFPPLGYEWGVPGLASGANAGVHVFQTNGDASSTPTYVDLIWSE